MTSEESVRIELRETGGESDTQTRASPLPSGPLLSTNGGPAAAENGGKPQMDDGYETKQTFSKKRKRVYKFVCLSLVVTLLAVLVISLSVSQIGSSHKKTGSQTSTVATMTEQIRWDLTSRPTVPAVILNIDSISVSLSLTFPSSTYKDTYSDRNSLDYREIESNFTRNIDGVLQNGEFSTVYDRVTVDDIRSGSIIIDMTIHLTGIPIHLHGNLASVGIPEMELILGMKVQTNLEDGYPSDDVVIFKLNGAKISASSLTTIAQEISIPIVHNPRCFQCSSSPDCIPLSWKCDGDTDCNEGEDEMNCSCDEGFLCSSGVCVDQSYRCDGLPDCDAGEDEMNCTCNSVAEYRCPSTQSCIPKGALCDFNPDCPHHEDESESVCHFDSFAENTNLTIGSSRAISLPINRQETGFIGPGSFGLWFFSSPENPAEFLINITISFRGSGGSFVKLGTGLNATRGHLAAFTESDAMSPGDLNPFYARSENIWVIIYQSDYDIVEGAFSVTAVLATDCADGEIACQFSPECIPPGGRCDGNEDCTFTGEDETLCLSPPDPDEMNNNYTEYSSSSDSFSSSAYFGN
ncbi:serine protease nudel-like isoform X1 [Lytechinus pictus]|uniref:serine protease nudel-like isoform X1 n=1 Tax=Lytechinus pictus TaxID=7653 RepID=UPI0030B9CF93